MLRFLLGPLILVVLLATTDFNALGGAFRRTQPTELIWAYLSILPTIPLRTLRWRFILGPKFRPPTFRELLGSYTYAIFVGVVTPGRLGEFVKIVHVTKWGAPTSVAFVKVFVDRLFDVLAMLTAAAIGLWVIGFKGFDTEPVLIIGVVSVVVAVVGSLIVLRDVKHGGPIARFIARVVPTRLHKPLQELRDEFRSSSTADKLRVHGSAAVLTIAAWGFNYLANYLLAQALGLPLSFVEVASISAISSLVALVPITILGAGTRDATLIILLAALGGTKAEALAFSALLLSLILWLAIVCTPSAWLSARRAAAKAVETQ